MQQNEIGNWGHACRLELQNLGLLADLRELVVTLDFGRRRDNDKSFLLKRPEQAGAMDQQKVKASRADQEAAPMRLRH